MDEPADNPASEPPLQAGTATDANATDIPQAAAGAGSEPAASGSAPAVAAHAATDPATQVGVPQKSNFDLPSFDEYGQPFFERDGLKFRIGPVHISMQLGLVSEYNDNIYASETNAAAAMVVKIQPGIKVGMGDYKDQNEDYLLLNYQPDFVYYMGYSDQDRVDQSLDLSGQATFSRFSTNVDLSYVDTNEPNATQTGRQSYQLFNFNWQNSYLLATKTSAQMGITITNQSYENGDEYTTYSVSPQIGYQFSPKTMFTFGPYAGIAYINSSSSSFDPNTGTTSGSNGTQTFQGATVGIIYNNLRKLKFTGVVGVQSRQFHGFNASAASNFTTPIFDFSVQWIISEKSTLNLEFARNVQISDFIEGLTYTNDEVNFSINHQLTSHVSLRFGASYQNLDYQGNSSEVRKEQYVSLIPTITYSFWRNQCSLMAYYRRQQRTSTLELNGYIVNTYGVQFNYQF